MTARAVLYSRVSTEEQVEHGYSLGGQARKLREFAANEGWRVVEEIEDDGYSGADPYRPGLRRVLELVERGEVDVVVAAKRDRLFRSRFYRLSFERDLEDFGVKLMALNDTGHKIGDGVLDDFAEWEREMIAERLHGGIKDMVSGGEIKAGPKPPYGFRFDGTGKMLAVHEPEMSVLRRIFWQMAAGASAGSLVKDLEDEGVPGPSGLPRWNKRTIGHFLGSDLYRPHGAAEVAGMVASEAAARLDTERVYALWSYGQRKTAKRKEWDGEKFVTRYSAELRPRDEWLIVPVDVTDAGLSRAVVDRAREAARDRYREPSGAAGRFWQLRGVAKCGECGSVLSPHTVTRRRKDGTVARTSYYQCRARYNNGARRDCGHTRSYPAPAMEMGVWEAVYGLLSDPDRLKRQHDAHVERLRREMRGDPDKEARELTEGLQQLERRRSGYIDMAADGTISREDLRAKLAGLEARRKALEEALRAARNRHRSIEEAERAWELAARMLDLDRITFATASAEDRRRLYAAFSLKAEVYRDGTVRLSGIFDPEIRLFDVLQDAPDPLVPHPQPGDKLPRTVVASGNTH